MPGTIQKKICMLGAFSVGKTSLVQRFVRSIFSDRYLTTIGVKIEKKSIRICDTDVALIIWDIQGEDDIQELRMAYLRGMSGYILVIDGTRGSTLDVARSLVERVEREAPGIPFICCINKHDLVNRWEISDERIDQLRNDHWDVILTSALNGEGVEDGFNRLAERMISPTGR